MSKTVDISEPTSELERLIVDLSGSGQLVFVFGIGWWTAHLTGPTTPVFRGPADRRWWHVELGDGAANWIMDVRVDEISGVALIVNAAALTLRGGPRSVFLLGSLAAVIGLSLALLFAIGTPWRGPIIVSGQPIDNVVRDLNTGYFHS